MEMGNRDGDGDGGSSSLVRPGEQTEEDRRAPREGAWPSPCIIAWHDVAWHGMGMMYGYGWVGMGMSVRVFGMAGS